MNAISGGLWGGVSGAQLGWGIAGLTILVLGLGIGSWAAGLLGAAIMIAVGVRVLTSQKTAVALDTPWSWPPEYRTLAEAMARPIDPTPQRILPPDEKSSTIAAVATTPDALARLIADAPPAWPWAVFTSVLVQRRNAVGGRLRACASGYQPRIAAVPQNGMAYSRTAYGVMRAVTDLTRQLEQFVVSPAFKGAFGDSEQTADAEAILGVAHRLMDYHDGFLAQAEVALQTPVDSDVLVFVADMGAFALLPLIGYQRFIPTMCERIGQAQDLLPYTDADTVVALDDVTLQISMPDSLVERISDHVAAFTARARN